MNEKESNSPLTQLPSETLMEIVRRVGVLASRRPPAYIWSVNKQFLALSRSQPYFRAIIPKLFKFVEECNYSQEEEVFKLHWHRHYAGLNSEVQQLFFRITQSKPPDFLRFLFTKFCGRSKDAGKFTYDEIRLLREKIPVIIQQYHTKSKLNIYEWALVNGRFNLFYSLVLLADNTMDSVEKFYDYWSYARKNCCCAENIIVANRLFTQAKEFLYFQQYFQKLDRSISMMRHLAAYSTGKVVDCVSKMRGINTYRNDDLAIILSECIANDNLSTFLWFQVNYLNQANLSCFSTGERINKSYEKITGKSLLNELMAHKAIAISKYLLKELGIDEIDFSWSEVLNKANIKLHWWVLIARAFSDGAVFDPAFFSDLPENYKALIPKKLLIEINGNPGVLYIDWFYYCGYENGYSINAFRALIPFLVFSSIKEEIQEKLLVAAKQQAKNGKMADFLMNDLHYFWEVTCSPQVRIYGSRVVNSLRIINAIFIEGSLINKILSQFSGVVAGATISLIVWFRKLIIDNSQLKAILTQYDPEGKKYPAIQSLGSQTSAASASASPGIGNT